MWYKLMLLNVEQKYNHCPALSSGRITLAPEGIPFRFFTHLDSAASPYNVFGLVFVFGFGGGGFLYLQHNTPGTV